MISAPPTDSRKALDLFGLGNQQRSPFISTVSRTNCIVEMTENGRQQAAIFGLPGLEEFINLGDVPSRGIFSIDRELTFYSVNGDQIVKVSLNQNQEVIGTLTTIEGPVWMDYNGAEIFINDGVTAYVYNVFTELMTQVTDPNFPVGARGGVFVGSRFFVYVPAGEGLNRGRVYASDQYDGLSWDPLNFFSPESVPDGIVAIYRWFNDLLIFGHSSIEWWAGAPTVLLGALGFRPVTGANTEVGLDAELGIAGTNQDLFFVGHGNGQTAIYMIDGYRVKKISTPAIDDELAKRPTHQVSLCTAYMVSGHPIFQITLPNEDDPKAITLIYDTLTQLWSNRESHDVPYYRGVFAVNNSDSVYITDAFTGKIGKMVDTIYTEFDDPIVFEITGIHMLKEGDTLAASEIQIDMETGLGISVGQGSNPQGMIQISKDGGHTWLNEHFVPLGKIGEYKTRASLRRIGGARDIAVRFRITDPVPRRVSGAYLKLEQGLS